MCKIVLDRGNFADFTSISNVFIDEYMPKANGEFVKIYLHLLRLVNSDSQAIEDQLSTEKIADRFNMLESDVMRAFNYWESQGLICLTHNEKGEISGIKLESAICSRYIVSGIGNNSTIDSNESSVKVASATNSNDAVKVISNPVLDEEQIIVPKKKKYSAKDITSLKDDKDIQKIVFLSETYLGKTLSSTDLNSIIYILKDLHIPVELFEYIMETCISLGHKTFSYFEKQAVLYYKKQIFTVQDAKADEQMHKAIFQSIYKIFGLSPKAPVEKDLSFVSKWTNQYGFTDELIIEACNRTMAKTHSGSFEYTDGILTNWFNKGATSMDLVETLDKEHAASFEATTNVAKRRVPKKKAASFDQRTYDYEELEKKLLSRKMK